MPFAPDHYIQRAIALELAAAKVNNRTNRQEYLDLAEQMRRMARAAKPFPNLSDIEVQKLAERMVSGHHAKP